MDTSGWTYPGDHARRTPDKVAIINGTTGTSLTYAELEARSNRYAHYLREQGLRAGDHVAVLMDNHIRYFEIVWAAMRSGLVITAINRFLTPDEAAYIVADSNAKAIVCSHGVRALAEALSERMPACPHRLMVDGTADGWPSFEATVAAYPAEPIADEQLGVMMLYSSGTTGRPKGIVRTPHTTDVRGMLDPFRRKLNAEHYAFFDDMVYLSPAPLYHAAPLGWAISIHAVGGTVVFMEKFDPAHALALIQRYRITHSQWVPTMFVRMLKLPDAERLAYDLSSLRFAIHSAAPCPVDIKLKMIDWWGPVIFEYYGSSEGVGLTTITSEEYLAHRGSVGRSVLGTVHICDDDGNELPVGETGLIYFGRDNVAFQYHNAPDKTRSTQHPRHPTWMAVGDVGYVDAYGYLYLTDRTTFMIISGGVNIYPQAIEDALISHPKVSDAAVIGVPDDEMGEAVKAVVQVEPEVGPGLGPELAEELIAYLRGKVARYMVPKSVDFVDQLPRLPTGKLYKTVLRKRYWTSTDTKA
ncbi:acyl-CoA synthetase [Paraburkholderia saeva]|uniref:acyl-CoA synthetase n=1 Tax=Paraburkholderia saeva TaxID=2777537 RepID=UPI001D1D9832|nr:acyl-CoA synthetase [Paraburkholderia saeva]CAG4886994.1 Long-chain-fatty-acid--CoA ligase [Paraburkholderia saeva]